MRRLMSVVAMELRLGRKSQDLWRQAEYWVEHKQGLDNHGGDYQQQVARCYAKLRCQQLDRASQPFMMEQIRKCLSERGQDFSMQLVVLAVGLLCSLAVFYRLGGGL